MTTRTVYVPRLIESAEQAEALPVGTVAVFAQHGTPSTTAIKLAGPLPGWWLGDERVLPWEVRGWSALVPIEAEEEWEDDGRPVWSLGEGEVTPADVDDYERRNGRRPSRRLVTPWEDA